MTIHTLEKEKHNDFLEQERVDPITGDLLEANDKIVLCAACKSAFLADSWEYIGRTHCNQNGTLREIPKKKIFKLDKNSFSLGYLNIETLSPKLVLKAHEGVFSSLGIIIDILLITLSFDYFYIFIAYFLGLVVGRAKYNYFNSYSKTLEIENRSLIIDRGLKTQKTVGFEMIEGSLHGKKSIYSYFLSLGFMKKADPTSDLKLSVLEDGKHKTYNFLIEEYQLQLLEIEHELLTKLDRIVESNKKSNNFPSFRATNDNQIENL